MGRALTVLGQLLRLPVDPGPLLLLGKFVTMMLGALVVLGLVRAELRDRSVDRGRNTVWRAGAALLVAAMSLPAVYAWYTAVGLFVLAAAGGRRSRLLVLALCSALTFTSLPPLYGVARFPVALSLLAVTALLGSQAVVLRRQSPGRPGPTRPAGDAVAAEHPRGWDGDAHRRWARAMAVAVLALSAVGLVGADADAGTAARRQAPERQRLVTLLKAQYPALELVRIDLPSGIRRRYRVEMVVPGDGTCEIVYDGTLNPASSLVRVSPVPHRTPRATDGRTCPAPTPAAAEPR